jgi:hypothetical protein
MHPRIDHRQALIEFFENHPAVLAQMLTDHVDDGTGHCRACRGGGTASAPQSWRCQVRVAADTVTTRQARRRRVS